ncbi:MAG: Pr6Pr family membrane protein [Bifidobacteriaceae bacterium]|nr:Pr6Pr family membrane protein [Bifidobacteriaceae bacterium]
MQYFVIIWRLVIGILSFIGVQDILRHPADAVYFTYQSNIFLGIVMIWSALAMIFKKLPAPHPWIKGSVLLFLIITASVAALILPPDDPKTATYVFTGVMANDLLHRALPLAAAIDFLLFDRHRKYKISYAFTWLGYIFAYVIVILIRGHFFPHSGPRNGTNPYPYFFIDVSQLGYLQVFVNIIGLAVVFYLLGLFVFLVDKVLPEKMVL